MKDFVSQIISSIIVVPLAYLAGYKLRQYVPKGRRFFVGFVVVLSFITIAFAIVLGLPMISRLAKETINKQRLAGIFLFSSYTVYKV